MSNYSGSQHIIDLVLQECAARRISHDDLVYALMLLLLSDMRAFDDEEHQLTDRDTGELMLHVRKFVE